ncbi:unnamed protein product [Strongylus vulgaris]|uniref:Uncharacterized protein n=1 Tax=Strongylus vulgaris TaxID=40348 RepID=A0A3P7J3W8_STRVU|nr:unnamed protein product [Strongylus vulgaris]
MRTTNPTPPASRDGTFSPRITSVPSPAASRPSSWTLFIDRFGGGCPGVVGAEHETVSSASRQRVFLVRNPWRPAQLDTGLDDPTAKFFEDAMRERDSMQLFGAYMGEKNAWRSKFIPWLHSMNLVDESALADIRLLVHKV